MLRSSIRRLILLLCLASPPAFAQSDLLVLTSDFATGSTALLPAGASEAQVNLLGIHSDAVGVFQERRIYLINRLGQDNVIVLDPADVTTPLTQFSVGNGTNPHDIEILSPDKAYVSRYDDAALLIVDPRDGSERGTIDLSAVADGDGRPEMSQIVRVGDRVYVACQRLDRDNGFVPLDAVLVVIDPATDTVAGQIPLSVTNPNSVVVAGSRIVVAGSAGFGDRLGGIDIVDTATGRSLGIVVSEESLGGDLSALTLHTSNRAFAVLLDENFASSVVPVNLESGAVGAPLEGISGGYIPSVAIDGGRLLVADQGRFDQPGSAGLKIFDAATGALLAGPIDTGLPPASLVVLTDARVTAVREEASATPDVAGLGEGFPNPFNATVRIPFQLDRETAVQLQVFDALGRPIRTLVDRRLGPASYSATWDGRDAAGRLVANGAYFVRLGGAGAAAVTKVMLLK